MNFDQIINSITFEEFKETLLKGIYAQLQWYSPSDSTKTKMNKIQKEFPEVITKDWNWDTLTNIAYFARAIAKMHPGWEEWDKYPRLKGEKEQFKSDIEKLYNSQSRLPKEKRLIGDDLLVEFYKIAGSLRDSHLEVFSARNKEGGGIHFFQPVNRKTKLKYRPEIEGSVGKNLAFLREYRKNDPNTLIFHLEDGPLVIAERTINGKKIGLIGLSTCRVNLGTRQEAAQKNAFNQIVKTLQNNIKNWDSIILDVRGNRGGIPEYLLQIAGTICGCKAGTAPPYCSEARARETEEEKLYAKFFLPPYTQKKYPRNSFSGKQKVLVLADKETYSSGEFVYPLFKQYKNTLFIGENTGGCCHYGGISFIALPCSGFLKMGSSFYDFGNGYLVEKTGFTPDINCMGEDALQVAYDHIKKSGLVQKRLSEGKEEGKEVGKNLSIFPKWLKNPSWLWHRSK